MAQLQRLNELLINNQPQLLDTFLEEICLFQVCIQRYVLATGGPACVQLGAACVQHGAFVRAAVSQPPMQLLDQARVTLR